MTRCSENRARGLKARVLSEKVPRMKIRTPVLIAFGLSVSSLPALAAAPPTGFSMTEIQVLEADLRGLSNFDEPACPGELPATKTRVVLFEGAGGYCPRYAHLNLKYDADGLNTLADRLAATKETYENLPYLRKVRALIGEEDKSKNCYLARNIHQFQDKMAPRVRSRFEVLYYSKDGESSAAKCAAQSLKSTASVRVVGFSMGGYATVQFANVLNDLKVPIEEVLSMDPVGKNVLLVTGVFFALDNPFIKRTPNAIHWQNIFQKIDTKSIFDSPVLRLGARGSRVIGADSNLQILASDYKTKWELDYPHYAINLTDAAQAALGDVFR